MTSRPLGDPLLDHQTLNVSAEGVARRQAHCYRPSTRIGDVRGTRSGPLPRALDRGSGDGGS